MWVGCPNRKTLKPGSKTPNCYQVVYSHVYSSRAMPCQCFRQVSAVYIQHELLPLLRLNSALPFPQQTFQPVFVLRDWYVLQCDSNVSDTCRELCVSFIMFPRYRFGTPCLSKKGFMAPSGQNVRQPFLSMPPLISDGIMFALS